LIDIDLESIINILWELYKEKKDSLHKADINECPDLPSFNTCTRRGLILNKVNAEFSEKLYYINPRLCSWCNLPLAYLKRNNSGFCSRACSAQASNTKRAETRRSWNYSVNCLSCGSKISDTYTNRKYCDQKCQKDFGFEQRFRDWYESGKSFGNRVIRDFLSTISGYSCAHCGISEWNGSAITLEVEHIDGNSEDSSPENVCLLCPNCHSQTPTYKGRNVGNGRHKRRLRYQEGKSY